MRHQGVLAACLLLLWTVSVMPAEEVPHIFVRPLSQAVEVVCPKGYSTEDGNASIRVEYKDENSNEYTCNKSADTDLKVYVKFHTCDNCVELDPAAIVGIVVGNIVATTVMGVAVYLVTSQTNPAPVTSNKKSSDRHPLVQNEPSRGSNDHYQQLRGGKKDVYDEITKNRRLPA